MNEIAVYHPYFDSLGGAEAVCLNVLEALQDVFRVDLVTLSRPDLYELNSYYRTEVDDVSVQRLYPLGPILYRVAERSVFGTSPRSLFAVLAKNYWEYEDYDLVISTANDFHFDVKSLQYIHCPPSEREQGGWVTSAYSFLTEHLDVREGGFEKNHIYLTNSNWTSRAIAEQLNVDSEPVYPPVRVDEYTSKPWPDRECGFVVLGRIQPTKNVLENIDIVSEVRERGHDVHLHVVGPSDDDEYHEKVKGKAGPLEYVTLEGSLPTDELVEILANHRYGLHGKNLEHFGIVVAEFAASGMVPFVPDGGGQREIVDDALLYSSVDEAVEKISNVLSDSERQRSLRPDPDRIRERFGHDRFQREIREKVEAVLERNDGYRQTDSSRASASRSRSDSISES